MPTNESDTILDVPEYRIQHIQHPDTKFAVRIDGTTYVHDPETDSIATDRFIYNSWDGLVDLVLAVLDEHVLLTHGDGELTVCDRNEFEIDHQRLHALKRVPEQRAPYVERNETDTSVETDFGIVHIELTDADGANPSAPTASWSDLSPEERIVALLRQTLAVLTEPSHE